MTQPVDDSFEQEYRNWQIAFERCRGGLCCPVNTRHIPHCPRRAERLARERWVPEMEARSEIGGRRGCVWMFAAIALTSALAVALPWWLVAG